ncbi:lytic transglycosylase domain-containing protein [Saccharibacter floricola]|nr:lytic transglycosylase domain-containing protein [Saccharibacter floricola]
MSILISGPIAAFARRHLPLLFLGASLSLVPTTQAADTVDTQTIATRLHEWQLLTGSDGSNLPAKRYASFLQNPQIWPLQNRLSWRYQNALLSDDAAADRPALCPSLPITQWQTLTVCAPFLKDVTARARALWVSSVNGNDEHAFLHQYGTLLTPSDQWNRYVHLETSGQKTSAQRQIDRLTPSEQKQARARFALRFNQDNADDLYAQATQSYEPTLLLLRLKYLRRQNRYDEAVQLWQSVGLLIEQQQALAKHTAWINERLALARCLLRQSGGNNPTQALLLISAETRSVPTVAEQEEHLLGAYIHLVLLNEPASASTLLQPLLSAPTLTARAAGAYWSARSEEALHHGQAAQKLYEKASAFPTTFYGQIALARLTHSPFLNQSTRSDAFLIALQQHLDALPTVSTGEIIRPDLAEAARLLHDQGDDTQSTLFLSFLQGQTRKDADQKAVADLAHALQLPQPAILATRALARHGIALYPTGYPSPAQLTSLPFIQLPSGLTAALIRQESSANPTVMSPRQAVGLMQLLPGTARLTARRHNISTSVVTAQSLTNPSLNMTLGQFYLQELLQRFDNILPYALAAYNAGPGRVHQWNNDPIIPLPEHEHTETDDDQLLHWVMLVPYQETRFYIEHIETDMALYALSSRP